MQGEQINRFNDGQILFACQRLGTVSRVTDFDLARYRASTPLHAGRTQGGHRADFKRLLSIPARRENPALRDASHGSSYFHPCTQGEPTLDHSSNPARTFPPLHAERTHLSGWSFCPSSFPSLHAGRTPCSRAAARPFVLSIPARRENPKWRVLFAR